MLSLSIGSPALAANKPNIIFILADDLGYGDIGVFFQNLRKTTNVRSEPWHQTPKLDQVAAEGIQLRDYYCPSPVSAPSRASLLTGVHQGHAAVRDNQFDKALEENHTLGTVLKKAGYATAVIGKWGLQGSGSSPSTWPAYPTKRGFDYYFGYISHNAGHEHYPKEGLYSGVQDVWDQDTEISAQLDKCYTTDLFTARAKKWIVDHQASNSNEPFFLYLAFDTPHAVIELPTQAYPSGGGLTGGLQWTGSSGQMINTASGTIDSYIFPDYANATWDHDANSATAEQAWPDVYKRYATAVRRIDDAVGDLIQTLKDLGVDDNTLIVFTSDNGVSNESYLSQSFVPNFFNSFGPFDGIKRDCWEGGVRVGALVRWPNGIPANRVSTAPSQAHDWMATFAELAGVTPPARTDGVSIVPTLTGTGNQVAGTVYSEYYYAGTTPSYTEFQAVKRGRTRNQMQFLRIGDYVGVRYNVTSQEDNFEIYNIVTDPEETNNLAGMLTGLEQQFKQTVLRIRRPNSSASRPYDSEPVPSITTSAITSGVNWAAYANSSAWVPKLDVLTPETSGTDALPNVADLPRKDNVAMLCSGYIKIPTDGAYTFYVNADSGALLRIHDATVIDADYGYASGTEATGSINLKAGIHPYRLYYARQTGGTPLLALGWSSTSIVKQAVPATAFFRDGVGAPIAPIVEDDSAQTSQGTVVTIDVLANDLDDGLPSALSIQSVGTPKHGTATIVSGKIVYTPAADFLGSDAFAYTATDGAESGVSHVTVKVGYFDGTYWFPFNQTTGLTTEEAGGLASATLHGYASANAPWVDGKANHAITFDGTSNYVSIDDFSGILGTNPRTIAAWVKTTYSATSGDKPIVAWGPNSSGNKWTFLMNSSGLLRLECTGGYVVGSRLLNDGAWHHVAATFVNDGSPSALDIKLYVDGTPETLSKSQGVTINTTSSGEVNIGTDIQSRFWQGAIDEVRIFNRALSAAEVLAIVQEADPSGDAWQRRNFGAQAVDWTADDDHDASTRLAEYAFGTDPRSADKPTLPAISGVSGGVVHAHFPRRVAGSSALKYTVEWSTDLVQWQELSLDGASITSSSAEFDEVAFDVAEPTDARSLFLRLKINH